MVENNTIDTNDTIVTIDKEKILNTIIFFMKQLNSDTKYNTKSNKNINKKLSLNELYNLMFLADKYHLKKYMRPIFNDDYIKVKNEIIPKQTNEFIQDLIQSYKVIS